MNLPWLLRLAIAHGLVSLWLLTGCAALRLPAIDPTGGRIFLPHPNSTELVWPDCDLGAPGRGLLPAPAFQTPPDIEDCPDPAAATAAPGTAAAAQPDGLGLNYGTGVWRAGLLRRTLFPLSPEAGVNLIPNNIVVPVGSEVIMVGGVCDGDGFLRKREPVEWLLGEGSVGTFVDLNQPNYPVLHTLFRGPVGGKICHNHAVGETVTKAQLLDRGTAETGDDVNLEAGQAWITLTSASEGTSQVTLFAPEVPNWDLRQQTALIHWVDAQWVFPPPAFAGGSGQDITTVVTRRTDNGPVANWLVRYEILGGAPATLGAQGLSAVEVPTDGNGRATVRVTPTGTTEGGTQIGIQIIRPGRTAAEPARLVLAQGSTMITWSTANLAMSIQAMQPEVALGLQLGFRIVVANQGNSFAEGVVVRGLKPAGAEFVGSVPQAIVFNPQLEWRLGRLEPNQSQSIDVTLQATQPGAIQFCATAQAGTVTTPQQCATTQVVNQPLQVTITGARNSEVGQRLVFDITVTNQSNQPLNDVAIKNFFDPGLRSNVGGSPIERTLPTLGPGQYQTFQVGFDVIAAGRQCQRVEATHSGGATAQAEFCTDVLDAVRPQAAISVQVDRNSILVNDQVTATIVVENQSDARLTRVQVVDQFDRGLQFENASDGYREELNQLIWTFPELPPRGRLTLQVLCRGTLPESACHRVEVTSDEGAQARDQVCLQVVGGAGGSGSGSGGIGTGPQAPAVTSPNTGLDNVPQLPRPDAANPGNAAGAGLEASLNLYPPQANAREDVQVLITIQNLANVDFRRVVTTVIMPDGVDFLRADSSMNTAARFGASNRTVVFDPVEVIRAGERALTYRVLVRPRTAGPFDFGLQVDSPDLARPLQATRTLEVLGGSP